MGKRLVKRALTVAILGGLGGVSVAEQRYRDDPIGFRDPALVKQATVDASRAFLDANGVAADTVRLSKVWMDERGLGHTRWQQMVDGVPVWGGEGILHLRGRGIYDVTNEFVQGVQTDTTPTLDRAAAEAIGRSAVDCDTCEITLAKNDLWVARLGGVDRLVYRVGLVVVDANVGQTRPVYFIDAHNGEVASSYDDLQTATGSSLYRGTVTIPSLNVGGTRYLEDTTRRIGVFDFQNGTSSASRMTDTDDVWNADNQRVGVDVQFGSAAVMDYLKNVLGRNGINGNNGPTVIASANNAVQLQAATIHYSNNYNNAFWDGRLIVIGDGDGSLFSPLASLDVIAHEYFHGVTQFTANLTYNGESGALNESISDVFGAMVERRVDGQSANTWKIGEAVYTPGVSNDALRYFDDPRRGNQPDHYADRYTGTQDNGGVHVNSGIANHAFYLLAAGGTHRRGGSMTGIGADAATKIWYRALTTYLTSASNFADARTATSNAARDIHGANSNQQLAVQRAWCLVGVGACPAVELLTNGGLESSLSPWVSSGTGVTYKKSGGGPRGGTGNLLMGVAHGATGSVYQQIAIPSDATPSLSLYVGVTSADTSATEHDRLYIEVRDSSNTLLATLGTVNNTNRTSGGTYAQKGPYSLASYAGQTVRIALRVATDATLATTFKVDDLSVK